MRVRQVIQRGCAAAGLAILLALLPGEAHAAGPRTHAEIGRRAWRDFLVELEPMLPGLGEIQQDPDAMRAFWSGCTFPDFAQNGIHDEAAEFSHWYRFQRAHFDYVKAHYPPPWNADARRHLAFFFGVLCHGVGDIPWHFDEWGHQAFMNAAWEHDGRKKEIEAAGEVFCHVQYRLKPALRGRYWWPKEEMQAVFANTGFAVTAEQLDRGCRVLEKQWHKGRVLGPLVWPYGLAAYGWTWRNLAGYYYGGLDNGAAYSASCIAYYYARLHDWRYYQNIQIQNNAFPERTPFLPCQDTTVRADAPTHACGGEPLLELKGGGAADCRAVLLRFDVSDWPQDKAITQATLALYLKERRGPRERTDRVIGAYRVNRPWTEGAAHSDPASGFAGVPSDGNDATWIFSGIRGETWSMAGCNSIPGDREPEPAARSVVRRKEPCGRWITWDITSLANDWAAHPERNFGLLLHETGDVSRSPGSLVFYSSQAFRANAGGPGDGRCTARHPILVLRGQ